MPQRGPTFPPSAVFDDTDNHVRTKVIWLYLVLTAANLLAWGWAFAAFHAYPLLLATAAIAYGFGLRHAVDADHIAAIDNVTRKLMQEGKRPLGVGLFFSLGHSTVVVLASMAIAAANIFVLAAVYRSFARVRRGGRYVEEDLDHILAQRGLLGRLFRPLIRL